MAQNVLKVSWQQMHLHDPLSGAVVRDVSVGADGWVWYVDTGGRIRVPGNFLDFVGFFDKVSVANGVIEPDGPFSPKNNVWGLLNVNGSRLVSRFEYDNGFVQFTRDDLVDICAVVSTTDDPVRAYGVTANGALVEYADQRWETIFSNVTFGEEWLTRIAGKTNTGGIRGQNENGDIVQIFPNYKLGTGTPTSPVKGNLSQISVGADGTILGVNFSGDLLVLPPGDEALWSLVERPDDVSPMKKAAIGNAKDLYSLDVKGNIWYLPPTKPIEPQKTGFGARLIDTTTWNKILQMPHEDFTRFDGARGEIYQRINEALGEKYHIPGFDIRSEYANNLVTGNLSSNFNELFNASESPEFLKRLHNDFSECDIVDVVRVLTNELTAVGQINRLFNDLAQAMEVAFSTDNAEAIRVFKLLEAQKNVPPARLGFLNFLFALLGAALNVVLAGAGEAVSTVIRIAAIGVIQIIGATTELAVGGALGESRDNWIGEEPLPATESEIMEGLIKNFDALSASLAFAQTKLLTSPNRLMAAQVEVNKNIQITPDFKDKLGHYILTKGFAISLFQTLLPLKYFVAILPNNLANGTMQNTGVSSDNQIKVWKAIKEKAGSPGPLLERGDAETPYLYVLINNTASGFTVVFFQDPIDTESIHPPEAVATADLCQALFAPQSGDGYGIPPEDLFLGLGDWSSLQPTKVITKWELYIEELENYLYVRV